MEQVIDRKYLLETMEELINTPSPVGYYDEMNPLLEKYAASLGYELTYDRKNSLHQG